MDARRELVDDKLRPFARALEHLDAEHAHMGQRLGDFAGDRPRRDRQALRDVRRRAADGEDAALMHVLDRVVELQRAVLPAHHDDRDLPLEQDHPFDQCRRLADGFKRGGNFVLGADEDLALAVITEPPGLEQRRDPHA